MRKELLIAGTTGLSFAGIAYTVVNIFGYSSATLSVLLYLYVLLALVKTLFFRLDIDKTGLKGFLDKIVIVAEGEELKMRKLVTGEKYKIKGEVEKL